MINSAEDLRTRIRELGKTEPDPTRVAHAILESITPAEAVVIAGATLQNYVRLILTKRPFSEPAGKPTQPEPKTYTNKAGKTFVSAKSAAISDWAAEKRRHVHLSGRSWKIYGQCSRDDVLVLADSRGRKASELTAEERYYRRTHEAMVTHSVDLVEDLPEEVGKELLKR